MQKHHGVVAGEPTDAEKSLLHGQSFHGDRTDPLHINAVLSDQEVPAEEVCIRATCVCLGGGTARFELAGRGKGGKGQRLTRDPHHTHNTALEITAGAILSQQAERRADFGRAFERVGSP